MGSQHDLNDKLRQIAGANPLGSADELLQKVGEGRDRLGEVAADAVEALRDDADVAVHEMRRRGHRMRRDVRRRARAARRRRRLPKIAAALAALVGMTALLVVSVKGRKSIKPAAAAGTDKVKEAARRVSRSEPVESVLKK
jgi:ElaB/YqjD/DUF883 family membrane-anchored ribosome-binding protein